jgi:hypothetical protein
MGLVDLGRGKKDLMTPADQTFEHFFDEDTADDFEEEELDPKGYTAFLMTRVANARIVLLKHIGEPIVPTVEESITDLIHMFHGLAPTYKGYANMLRQQRGRTLRYWKLEAEGRATPEAIDDLESGVAAKEGGQPPTEEELQ